MFKSIFTYQQTNTKTSLIAPLISVFNVLLFLFFAINLNAQNPLPKPLDSLKVIDLQQVTVTATMATAATPMTFTNLSKDQIRRNDFGQDIPFLLKATPPQ